MKEGLIDTVFHLSSFLYILNFFYFKTNTFIQEYRTTSIIFLAPKNNGSKNKGRDDQIGGEKIELIIGTSNL